MYFCRASFSIWTEVRVWKHGHNRFLIEETYCLYRQFCYVDECIGIRMTVDQCIGDEICSFLGIQDVHCSEMVVSRLYTDNFLGYLDSIWIFGVQTCNKCIGFSCFHHHHTEIVTFEHLVVCFGKVCSFAGTFFTQYACVTFAAFCFTVVTEIYDFYSIQIQVEFFGKLSYSFFIT